MRLSRHATPREDQHRAILLKRPVAGNRINFPKRVRATEAIKAITGGLKTHAFTNLRNPGPFVLHTHGKVPPVFAPVQISTVKKCGV